MLSWQLDAVINVVLVGFALWVRRRPRPQRALGRVAIAYGALFVLSSLAGTVVAVLIAFDPFAGENLDSSRGTLAWLQIRCAATGVTAFLLPTIAALALYRRSHADTAQPAP